MALPPPIELSGHMVGIFFRAEKKILFLKDQALYPLPSLLVAGPLNKELFFCGYPLSFYKKYRSSL